MKTSDDPSWPRKFTPQKVTPVPTEQNAGSIPQLVWTFWRWKGYCPCQKPNHKPSNPQQNHYAQYGILSPHPSGSPCGICGEQSGNEQVFMQVGQIKTFTVVSSKFSAKIIRTAFSYFNRSTIYRMLHVSSHAYVLCIQMYIPGSQFVSHFQGFHLTYCSEYFTFSSSKIRMLLYTILPCTCSKWPYVWQPLKPAAEFQSDACQFFSHCPRIPITQPTCKMSICVLVICKLYIYHCLCLPFCTLTMEILKYI